MDSTANSADRDREDADLTLLEWLKTVSPEKRALEEEATELREALGSGDACEKRETATFVKALLPPTRPATAYDYQQARRWVAGWHSLGYCVSDVRPWLRAGVEPGDHEMVAELVAEGIRPQMLSRFFEHPRTGEHVTILRVAQSFFADFCDGAFTTLCQALDDAGVERVRGARPSWVLRRARSG